MPDLMDSLGISATSRIEVYNVAAYGWERHTAKDAFQVKTNQVLLARLLGVENCPEFEQCLAEARGAVPGARPMGPTLQSPQIAIHPPPRPLKRTHDAIANPLEPAARFPSMPRLTAEQLSPFAPYAPPSTLSPLVLQSLYGLRALASPVSDSGSSSPTLSPPHTIPGSPSNASSPDLDFDLDYTMFDQDGPGLGLISGTVPSSSCAPEQAAAACAPLRLPADPAPSLPVRSSPGADALDLSSGVHMPDGATDNWPERMYACDIARGFANIAALSGNATKNLEVKFGIVFPGAKFVHTTAHRQFRAWKLSTEDERRALLDIPRTREGLWTVYRGKLTGWPLSRSMKQRPGREI